MFLIYLAYFNAKGKEKLKMAGSLKAGQIESKQPGEGIYLLGLFQ